MKNKKGAFPTGYGSNISGLFWVFLLAVLILIIIANGGIDKVSGVVSALVKIPVWFWVALVIGYIVLKLFGGRR